MRKLLLLIAMPFVIASCKKESDQIKHPREPLLVDCYEASDEGRFEIWDSLREPVYTFADGFNIPNYEIGDYIENLDITSGTLDDSTPCYLIFKNKSAISCYMFIQYGSSGIAIPSQKFTTAGEQSIDIYPALKKTRFEPGCYRLYYLFFDGSNNVVTKGHYDLNVAITPIEVYGLGEGFNIGSSDTVTVDLEVKTTNTEPIKLSVSDGPSSVSVGFYPQVGTSPLITQMKIVGQNTPPGNHQMTIRAESGSVSIDKKIKLVMH